MNCDEFKRHVMSEPGLLSESIMAHQKDCPGCSEFIHEVGVFEVQVHDALQVPVPPDIKEEFASTVIAHTERSHLKKISFGLAATLFLMIGAAFFVNINTASRIENLVIAHIEKEPFTLTKNMHPTRQDIVTTLDTLGVTLNGDIGEVRFLKRCYVGEELVAHFVVEGQQGPVTILVMPNEALSEQRYVESDQLQGTIIPYGEGSSIAIIGYLGEPIKELVAKLDKAFLIKA